jgi:hypothetical protein
MTLVYVVEHVRENVLLEQFLRAKANSRSIPALASTVVHVQVLARPELLSRSNLLAQASFE